MVLFSLDTFFDALYYRLAFIVGGFLVGPGHASHCLSASNDFLET